MTRFSFVLFAICFGMFVGPLFAQEDAANGGTLRGTITDVTPAQNPIEGVEIKILTNNSTPILLTKHELLVKPKMAQNSLRRQMGNSHQRSGRFFLRKNLSAISKEGFLLIKNLLLLTADSRQPTAIPAGRYLINISKEGFGERIGKPVVIVNGGDHFMPLKMSNEGKVILPPLHVQGRRMDVQGRRMDAVVKVRIESLRQRVTESISKRYNLDEGVVKALHQSILGSIDSVLSQTESRNAFAKAMGNGNAALLNMLLARPACKAAFTEHLSEAQFQDYLDFAAARQQRDQQAAAHQITVLLDQELSLTPAQRENVVQLLQDEIENEAAGNAMRVLRISSPQAAAQLARYRLKIPMDGILSKAQSKVWLGLITVDTRKKIGAGGGTVQGMITDTTPAQNPIEGVEVQIVAVGPEDRNLAFIATTDVKGNYRHDGIPAGRYLINIYREGYGDRLEKPVTVVNGGNHFVPLKMVKIRKRVENIFDLFVPNRTTKKKDMADAAKPPDAMQFAEAKLQAHTELLGTLDARASQRLALAAKGVAQQHFETQDERQEKTLQGFEANLRQKN